MLECVSIINWKYVPHTGCVKAASQSDACSSLASNIHDIYAHICFKVQFDAVQMINFTLDELAGNLKFCIDSINERKILFKSLRRLELILWVYSHRDTWMVPHRHSNLLDSTCASLLSHFTVKPPPPHFFTILSICQLPQQPSLMNGGVSSRAGTEIVAVWRELASGKVILQVCGTTEFLLIKAGQEQQRSCLSIFSA